MGKNLRPPPCERRAPLTWERMLATVHIAGGKKGGNFYGRAGILLKRKESPSNPLVKGFRQRHGKVMTMAAWLHGLGKRGIGGVVFQSNSKDYARVLSQKQKRDLLLV